MKSIISNLIAILLLATCFIGCSKDNYDAPTSKLTGSITYNGSPVYVRGSGGAIQLQLYQDGWQLHNAITVYVGQDGTFSALLFDGQYKMVTKDGNGPWVNSRDTTTVNVKGSTNIELKVVPYYTISDTKITYANSQVTASFNVSQVVSTADIEYAMLIISKTSFADNVNNISVTQKTDASTGSVTMSTDLSNNTSAKNATALYGRVGVKIKGVDQAIYSDVVKLK